MDGVEQSPLEKLNDAVAEFAHARADHPLLVDVAVVVWEEVSYSDDAEPQRRMRYAIPTDNFSMSSSIGLLEAAGEYVRRDLLGVSCTCDHPHDEDD